MAASSTSVDQSGRGQDECVAHIAPMPSCVMTPQLRDIIKASEYLIEDIFTRFSPSDIGVAFNGGKDSVVMFELLRRVVAAPVLAQCCIFVVEDRDEFDELRRFREWYMREVAQGLSLTHMDVTTDMRRSLWTLTEKRPLRVVFMGTRKTDPHGRYQKEAVEKTTPGWPDFLRACPIFHWTVSDVWGYTRFMCVPQCNLYESGYSSLGRRADTIRNPLLKREDGTYRPAWELMCGKGEREGRGTL